jgi:LacI family transcriptional regulator
VSAGANDPAGRSRTTLRDIATATGLSLATVSLALNDKDGVSAENRQRVVEVARSLSYERPKPRPRPGTPTIGVLIERLPVAIASDPFNRPILQGLEAAARSRGYRVAVEFVGPDDHPDDGHWRRGATAGVLILGGGDLGPDWVRAAIESGIPAVMVDHVAPGLEVPTVAPDNLGGSYAVTNHLLALGHRRIGYIRGPSKYWTLGERLAGFLLAMQQAGVWSESALAPPRVSHLEEKGYGEMAMLLDLPEPPTAVVAVSDKAAIGAYKAARERGLVVPRDVSIVGFDDIEAAGALHPPLTTVRVPGEELGRVAFERLRQIVDGEDAPPSRQIRWTLPTSLMIRESTAPPG